MKLLTSMAIAALMLLGGEGTGGSAAQAADVYHKEGMKDEPSNFEEPVMVNWTGFYFGGQAGGSFAVLGDEDGQGGLSIDGFSGGGVIGFDYARGRFLVGIAAEYNFSNAALEVGGVTLLEKDNDMSGCGRLGYIAASRTLAYVKGCYTQIELTDGSGDSETFGGIGAGGGLEFAARNNVFLGVEARHTWFDEDDKLPANVSLDETTIMGTLKFKLNSPLPSFTD